MATREEQLQTGAELRESVDALTLRWLLAENDATRGSAAAEWSSALADIRQRAEAGGEFEAARVAAELLAGIAQGGPQSEQAIQAGLQRLQEALERAAAPAGTPETKAPDQQLSSLGEDPELVSDFIIESREHLQAIETHLLTLEQKPADTEAIHATFRGFHTIKGLAGFLGFTAVQELSHEVETVLDLARTAKLRITPRVIDLVLEAADYLKAEIASIENALNTGTPVPAAAPYEALVARIRGGMNQSGQAEDAAQAPESPMLETPEQALEAPMDAAADPDGAGRRAESTPKAAPAAATVKVGTAKLDFLVDMVGEMVIAQSLIRHNPELASLNSPRLAGNLSQLARITDEIQKTAMSMRMIPIGRLFQKMGRLVRDLSRKAGKHIELETFGEDTELDRNIVEELGDPLMHMVRNAIDHGIETPEARRIAGKPQVARVTLSARHQAGHILIEVADDGRGIDRSKVLAKAVDRGLIKAGAVLSDAEVFDLIFDPGFSTADQITDISGRGVGMDVVKKHIQKLRGRIEVQSAPGRGARFLLKVPLTLAIIDGLVVGVGQERYIIPIFAVKEMLRPTPDMVKTIENREEMACVRGSVLPVVRLHRRFGVIPRSEEPSESLLVIAESSGKSFCLMVDSLLGKQEVVIKGLGDGLKDVPGIAGGAILGDGRVGLILDMDAIFSRQHGSHGVSAGHPVRAPEPAAFLDRRPSDSGEANA